MLKALVWGEGHQAPPAAPPLADGRAFGAFRALGDPTEIAGLLTEPEQLLWLDSAFR